jgi:sugar/nucleoside kinase (ribokinase family)
MGLITSLDVALPDPDSESGKVDWEQILRKVMPYTDIFLPSFEEILYKIDRKRYYELKQQAGKEGDVNDLFTGDDLTRISDKLLKYGAKIIVIKCSKCGIYVRTAGRDKLGSLNKTFGIDLDNWSNREIWAPTYKATKIMSAAGSGDSSIAGFLAAVLNKVTVEQAAKCANAVGWQNLRAYDANSGVGTWKETITMVNNKKMMTNKLDPKSHNWIFNKTCNVCECRTR